MISSYMRNKYAKRKHGRNMSYPPGGGDIVLLCDVVDSLKKFAVDLISTRPADERDGLDWRLTQILSAPTKGGLL